MKRSPHLLQLEKDHMQQQRPNAAKNKIKINLKKIQTYRYWKQIYGYQRGNVGGGRDKSGAWDEHTHSTNIKIANQQGPTV